ncbi:MAG: hypothetical protein GQ570_09255 [Helicobacteraceae bacterium]|nr:hypothetical protein [Helicobacteraceae bacterium]
MNSRLHTKMIHEGKYMAEVEVSFINTNNDDWSPYLSLDDALKIDKVREALKNDDLSIAKGLAKIYIISEVAA